MGLIKWGGAFEEASENKSWLSLGGLLQVRHVSHKPSCKKRRGFHLCRRIFMWRRHRNYKTFFLTLLDSQDRSGVCFWTYIASIGWCHGDRVYKQALASQWGWQMRGKKSENNGILFLEQFLDSMSWTKSKKI